MPALCKLGLAVALVGALASTEQWQRLELPDAAQLNASCADGSPPVFYVQEKSAQQWLVYFEGGGFCESKAGSRAGVISDCMQRQARTPSLYSSRFASHFEPFVPRGTLTDEKENPFSNYSKMYVTYCSQDLWMGSGSVSSDGKTLHFQGLNIARESLAWLSRAKLVPQATLVLQGSSAGGFAVMSQTSWAKANVPLGMLKAIVDSSFITDMDGAVRDFALLDVMSEADGCSVPWRGSACCVQLECMAIARDFPPHGVPLFLVSHAYDPFLTKLLAREDPVLNVRDLMRYGERVRAVAEVLVGTWRAVGKDVTVFMTDCAWHVTWWQKKTIMAACDHGEFQIGASRVGLACDRHAYPLELVAEATVDGTRWADVSTEGVDEKLVAGGTSLRSALAKWDGSGAGAGVIAHMELDSSFQSGTCPAGLAMEGHLVDPLWPTMQVAGWSVLCLLWLCMAASLAIYGVDRRNLRRLRTTAAAPAARHPDATTAEAAPRESRPSSSQASCKDDVLFDIDVDSAVGHPRVSEQSAPSPQSRRTQASGKDVRFDTDVDSAVGHPRVSEQSTPSPRSRCTTKSKDVDSAVGQPRVSEQGTPKSRSHSRTRSENVDSRSKDSKERASAKSSRRGSHFPRRTTYHSHHSLEYESWIPPLCWREIQYSVPSGAKILMGVDGKARPGHITAIMGSSGSGKTTLLDILSMRRTQGKLSGSISCGCSLSSASKIRNYVFSIGYVSQYGTPLNAHLPLLECLYFSSMMRMPGASLEEQECRIGEVMQMVELQGLGAVPVQDMSGGQQRRVMVAVELLRNPAALLLDEPTSGLDSKLALCFMQLLASLAKRLNKTVLLTIHQPPAEAFECIDDLYLMDKGRAVYMGDRKLGVEAVVQGLTGAEHGPLGLNSADNLVARLPAFATKAQNVRVPPVKDEGLSPESQGMASFWARLRAHTSARWRSTTTWDLCFHFLLVPVIILVFCGLPLVRPSDEPPVLADMLLSINMMAACPFMLMITDFGNSLYNRRMKPMMREMQSQTLDGQAFLAHWLVTDLPISSLSCVVTASLTLATGLSDLLPLPDASAVVLLSISHVTVSSSIYLLALLGCSLRGERRGPEPLTIANVIIILLSFLGGLFNGLSYDWSGLPVVYRALGFLSPGFWTANAMTIHVLTSTDAIRCPAEVMADEDLRQLCTGESVLKGLGMDRFSSFLPQFSVVYAMGVSACMVAVSSILLKAMHSRSLKLFRSLGPS